MIQIQISSYYLRSSNRAFSCIIFFRDFLGCIGIIEKIIKERENSKILLSQNPLQKGFTDNSTALLCELFIEEFERESKDSKLPVYIAMLDGKSAFDVVIHANLIRRLFQIGISKQSILLLQIYIKMQNHVLNGIIKYLKNSSSLRKAFVNRCT